MCCGILLHVDTNRPVVQSPLKEACGMWVGVSLRLNT